jgi:pimeloyl-ACP methyl ester carboxylesterase
MTDEPTESGTQTGPWPSPADWGVQVEMMKVGAVELEVATAGDGDKLLLLLHGFPELAYSWRHQMGSWADAGYKVWAPNMRGYGNSARSEEIDFYRIENLLADVAALIDASGARTVTLVGHDWGAIVAWWFAMHGSRDLDSLVIMNVPHPAPAEKEMRRSPRQMWRSLYMLLFQLPRLPERVLAAGNGRRIVDVFTSMLVRRNYVTDADLDTYRRSALEPGALKAMVDYYRAYVRGGGHRRMKKAGYPKIEIPTLMIWGKRDTVLGTGLTRGTDEYVTDLTLHFIDDASHWVQQDSPVEVTTTTLDWLDR